MAYSKEFRLVQVTLSHLKKAHKTLAGRSWSIASDTFALLQNLVTFCISLVHHNISDTIFLRFVHQRVLLYSAVLQPGVEDLFESIHHQIAHAIQPKYFGRHQYTAASFLASFLCLFSNLHKCKGA